MKTKLTFLAIILSCLLHAQSLVWSKQKFSGTGNCTIMQITTDVSGNVYTTGSFNNTIDFDPGPGVFNLTTGTIANAFVCKLDANGNFVWAVKASSTNSLSEGTYNITADMAGNVYVVGLFSGTCDFDPGNGTNTLIAPFGLNQFLWKLDVNGDFVYARRVTPNAEIYGIAIDTSGNLFAAGYYSGGTYDIDWGSGTTNLTLSGSIDAYISKLDPAGNFISAKRFGNSGSSCVVRSIKIQANSNLYVVGTFSGTIDVDPGPGTHTLNSSDYSTFITKFDGSTNFISSLQLAYPTGSVTFMSVSTDPAGNVYTAGEFKGISDFDPSPASYTLYSATNSLFACKLNSAGGLLWVKSIDLSYNSFNPYIEHSVDGNGNVFFGAGQISATGIIDCDPSPGTHTASAQDGFISILNSSGNFISAITPPTIVKFVFDDAGSIYVLSTIGIYKYSPNLLASVLTFEKNNMDVSAFPNPSRGELTLQTNFSSNNLRFEICNSLGQKLQQQKITSQYTHIDLKAYEEGIYFLQVSNFEGTIWQKKIIKQ